MELRQLEAFVAVADELHFGRAAQRIQIGQPALSELVQRLERELGARLFVRTTRRVSLTAAGEELLPRARAILDQTVAARAAVRRVAEGKAGPLRIGITPPVAPVLAPYLTAHFADRAPLVTLTSRQVWLPELSRLLAAGEIDVGITCGLTLPPAGITHTTVCAEPMLVAMRATHRLAGADTVDLAELADDTLGMTRDSLFPAWALSQQQALAKAGIAPPTIELDDTDIAARRWQEQGDLDWIMLIGSFVAGHDPATIKTVAPALAVPFVLHWAPERASSAAAEFVEMVLSLEPPPGWIRGSGAVGRAAADLS